MMPHNGSNKTRWVLLFLCLLLQPFSIHGQEGEQEGEYSRTLSISQWIEEMAACEKEVYKLKDAKIAYRPEKGDSIYSALFYHRTKRDQKTPPPKKIGARVRLMNVAFPNKSIFIQNLSFKKPVFIYECQGTQVRVENFSFNKGLTFYSSEFDQIGIFRSNFGQRFI